MIEKLADTQHKIWAQWMSYLFEVSRLNEDGSVTIPADKVAHWKRQIETQYAELSDEEKESDLEQANKMMSVFQNQMSSQNP